MHRFIDQISNSARMAPESGIVELVNRGRDKPGLIPLWVGEADLPTPDFITRAAIDGLNRGETFYTHQRGIPALREALSRYHARHFGVTLSPDRFVVTGSGMQAIQLAIRATMGAGDEAIFFTPAWPNFSAAVSLAEGRPVAVPLYREVTDNASGWALDLDRVRAAVTEKTRVLFVNSPANPSGWTADRETLIGLRDLAREHGLWIIADEIYALFHFGEGRAPSLFDVMGPEDRIIFVNSFSKNWAMTGWRVGWVTIPEGMHQVFENLVQYSTSGVAQFMQSGAVAALDEGDAFIFEQVERAKLSRDILAGALAATDRVILPVPKGAFYQYFAVDGVADGKALAFRFLDEANVGLAPGSAFGAGTENFLRACFNRNPEHVRTAADRLVATIQSL